MGAHAPLPWTTLEIGTAAGSGGFHLYIVDANGRKICAVWGPAAEKVETAEHIINSANATLMAKDQPGTDQ